jgi:NAD(P)H-hydrate repair Nnr-like enzyme with NAD(P)H-hydrate epimerase domain
METATHTIRFMTELGADVPAVDSAQMREVDRIAVEETGPSLYQMMENAGRNLALLAMQLLDGGWERAKVLVLAGSGGNGDGGICSARHLANRPRERRRMLGRTRDTAGCSRVSAQDPPVNIGNGDST